MPGTSANNGHIDQLLTNVVVSYIGMAPENIAAKVFPTVPVDHQSDIYWKWPKGQFFRDDFAHRPMGGRARVTDFSATTDTYFLEEEALAAVIDDRERANQSNGMNVEILKTKGLATQSIVHNNRKWAAGYFTTGIWGRDVTGVASGPTGAQVLQWSLSTGTFINDIMAEALTMEQATGIKPNTLVLGSSVYLALANHASIIGRIQYVEKGIVTTDLLSSLVGVENVYVMNAIYNSAIEGSADSMSFICDPKSAWLGYAAPEPGLQVASAGYTFAWNGLLGGAAGPKAIAPVSRFRDDPAHSDIFEVRMAWAPKIVAADLGTFFTTIVA